MAIGCGPDVTGNLAAGAICASCAGQDSQCETMIDGQYARDAPASPIGKQPLEGASQPATSPSP